MLATAPPEVRPLQATPRTPSRRTHGGAIAAVARALRASSPPCPGCGQRGLMPWQRYVADVATELLEDGSWAYPIVVLEVQRQGGKTDLVCPVGCERAATKPGSLLWFTAQTRQDARDTFTEGYMRRLEASPLGGSVRTRRSNGSEGLWFPTGSSFRVFAPTPDAMHGKANELVVVDECWAFTGARGLELEQAILPTFTTTGGQLWIISAAGSAESAWLRSWVERGRAAVELGRRSGIAYFRFGLADELKAEVELGLEAGKLDPDSPELAHALRLVLDAHPAHGHTLNLSALRTAAEAMRPGEFLRAYATVWTETEERAIPASSWALCGPPEDAPPGWWPEPQVPVALAVEVALDRSDAAVMTAWRDAPGAPIRWDVLQRRPGPDSWVADYVQDVRSRRPVAAIGYVDGPASSVADELGRAGVELERLTAGEYATACDTALRSVLAGQVRHPDHPALNASVASAAKRLTADSWAWGRRESTASIATLVGATVATWSFDHAPPPMERPTLVTRRR